MKRTIESLRVERQYRNVIDTYLAYGRELMHVGCYSPASGKLQLMAYSVGIIRNAVEMPLLIVAPAFSTARSDCL
ncbi:MAG: hypothetical protein ACXWH0_12800 [Acidimicrobiia bacterium]